MNEDVLLTVIGCNEAEPLFGIVPFDRALGLQLCARAGGRSTAMELPARSATKASWSPAPSRRATMRASDSWLATTGGKTTRLRASTPFGQRPTALRRDPWRQPIPIEAPRARNAARATWLSGPSRMERTLARPSSAARIGERRKGDPTSCDHTIWPKEPKPAYKPRASYGHGRRPKF